MPYTVAGTLKLPETGQPAAGVILKFVALQSISPVLDRSESVIITSSTGAYSIQLEYNTYSVFATLYDNKPINCGQIVLNSTVATGLDLPTLLNGGYSEPANPSWIVELQRLANVTTSAAQSAAASAASAAADGAAQAALAKSHADKAALSEQASSESATRSESAAKRAEELVDQATGGALLKDQNLGDVPNKEAARTHLDVPSKSQLAQAISEAIGGVTPASIGARPDSWTPTAADVGARPSDWMPTAAQVGARPSNWLPSLEEIGAASSGSLDALQPAGSASFVYEGGALTQMTEQLPAGERMTAYSYTDGRLTKAVETLGQLVRTTTYNYQAGSLTGFTTTEGGA